MIDDVVNLEMVSQFSTELGKTVGPAVCRILDTAIRHRFIQRRIVSAVLPCGGHPCHHTPEGHNRIGILLRLLFGGSGVVKLEVRTVALEVVKGDITAVEPDKLGCVCRKLDGAYALVQTVHFGRRLCVVEVVLPKESGAVPVIVEHDHREALNGLTDTAILFLHGRFVRREVLIDGRQLRVGDTIGGSHVSLEGEHVGRIRIGIHGIGRHVGTVHLKAALRRIHIVVLGIISGGGSALYVHDGHKHIEGTGRVKTLHKLQRHVFDVALVLRHFRPGRNSIRNLGRKLVDDNIAVRIEDIVAIIQLQFFVDILRVGSIVLNDLVIIQILGVRTNHIDINAGVICADGDTHRGCLLEVIVCLIHTCCRAHTVNVQIHQTEGGLLLDNHGNADPAFVLIVRTQRRLFRGDPCHLRRYLKAAPAGHTGQDRSRVVQHITRSNLRLQGEAVRLMVLVKGLVIDLHTPSSRNVQYTVSVLVIHPAVNGIVPCEASECRGVVAEGRRGGIRFRIAPAICGQVINKAVGFSLNLHVRLFHRDGRLLPNGAALNGKHHTADIVTAVLPRLLVTVHRQMTEPIFPYVQIHIAGQGTGRIHNVLNQYSRILLHCRLVNAHRDDRRHVALFDEYQVGHKVLGLDLRAVFHGCRGVHIQHMGTVRLHRDGVCQLTVIQFCQHRADLSAIDLEMNRLASFAVWRDRIAEAGRDDHGRVIGGGHGNSLGLDGDIDLPDLGVYVRNLDVDVVGAVLQIRSNIQPDIALGDIGFILDDTVDADGQCHIACRQFRTTAHIFQGFTVEFNRALGTGRDFLHGPALRIADRDLGRSGRTATALTTTTDASDAEQNFAVVREVRHAILHIAVIHKAVGLRHNGIDPVVDAVDLDQCAVDGGLCVVDALRHLTGTGFCIGLHRPGFLLNHGSRIRFCPVLLCPVFRCRNGRIAFIQFPITHTDIADHIPLGIAVRLCNHDSAVLHVIVQLITGYGSILDRGRGIGMLRQIILHSLGNLFLTGRSGCAPFDGSVTIGHENLAIDAIRVDSGFQKRRCTVGLSFNGYFE